MKKYWIEPEITSLDVVGGLAVVTGESLGYVS